MKLYGFWRSLATFRVRIALNLKGIAFDEVSVNLMQGEQRGEAYRQVNSQAMLPALDMGDGPALFQSLAILEYLDETHPTPALLPTAPRDRARVRGLALIAACEAHPLVVPRVREYLEKDLHLSEAVRAEWLRHWMDSASAALEVRLASDPETGRFCHGDAPGIADICAVAHVAGSGLFGCDLTPYPTLRRVVAECMTIEAFASAHPLRQPGAPAPAAGGRS
jgi:maleylacetoacetate isomerase